jgi:tetratricopeptide (TPR) repeat protein
MMRKFFYILFLIFVATLPLFAADEALKGFYQGNTNYESGDYAAAIRAYEKILDQGLASGPLYFNLGNAYFKSGKLGKAVVNYERAKRWMPRDNDLRANLNYAQGLVKYALPMQSSNISLDELSLILAGLFLLLVILIFFRRRYTFIVILLIFIFVAGLVARKVDLIGKEAVVCVESVSARFEPRQDATVHYSLYEGAKISIVARDGNWVKVKRSDGQLGWMETSAVESI